MKQYNPYTEGLANDVFMWADKDSEEFFVGKQLAGNVVYPDFFANITTSWWNNQMS